MNEPLIKTLPPVILYREGVIGDGDSTEMRAARGAGFKVVTRRSDVPKNSQVIGRYSVLPYYKELAEDLYSVGSYLCNNYMHHRFVARIDNWVDKLRELTPATWHYYEQIPKDENGPFVLKGSTNSRKDRWLTHMYAADREALLAVRDRLMADTFIDQQGIFFRRYAPLRKLLDGATGMPITNEWRFFVYHDEIICGGYYWSNEMEQLAVRDAVANAPIDKMKALIGQVIYAVGNRCNFYTVDIGELVDGSWTVIELNDGQMAGLSAIDPDEFYPALAKAVHRRSVKTLEASCAEPGLVIGSFNLG